MPQGSTAEWKFDICCEFDCNVEFAAGRGIDCKGDFTKKPCMFLGEHEELNRDLRDQEYSEHGVGGE